MRIKLSAILFCTTVFASSAYAEPAGTIAAHGSDATWLFIQTADGMTFDGTSLKLSGVSPSMVMFADRPHRNAEAVPLQAFVDAWAKGGDEGFRADPPNAGVTTLVDGKFQVATVELSDPKLDGSTLTFGAKPLEGTVPNTGGQTSLFIDGGCSPWDPRC
jgi:hypothetical protein